MTNKKRGLGKEHKKKVEATLAETLYGPVVTESKVNPTF